MESHALANVEAPASQDDSGFGDTIDIPLGEYRSPATPPTQDMRSSNPPKEITNVNKILRTDLKTANAKSNEPVEVPVISFDDISDLKKGWKPSDSDKDSDDFGYSKAGSSVFDKVVSRSSFERHHNNEVLDERRVVLSKKKERNKGNEQRRVRFSKQDSSSDAKQYAVSDKCKVGYLDDDEMSKYFDERSSIASPTEEVQPRTSTRALNNEPCNFNQSKWPDDAQTCDTSIQSHCFGTKAALGSIGERKTPCWAERGNFKEYVQFPANLCLGTKKFVPLCETAEYKSLRGPNDSLDESVPPKSLCKIMAEPCGLPKSYYQLGMSGYGAAAAMGHISSAFKC